MHFGPAWPPTDADWMSRSIARAGSTLCPDRSAGRPRPATRSSGPSRRATFPPSAASRARAVSRSAESCGASTSTPSRGVVDRVQPRRQRRGGQAGYVRLAHFGGMVFTRVRRTSPPSRAASSAGAHIAAGEVHRPRRRHRRRRRGPGRARASALRVLHSPVERAAGGLLGSEPLMSRSVAARAAPRHRRGPRRRDRRHGIPRRHRGR